MFYKKGEVKSDQFDHLKWLDFGFQLFNSGIERGSCGIVSATLEFWKKEWLLRPFSDIWSFDVWQNDKMTKRQNFQKDKRTKRLKDKKTEIKRQGKSLAETISKFAFLKMVGSL